MSISCRRYWIRLCFLPAFALQACSEPAFVFRDYSSRSDCQHVIDTELNGGATFDAAYDLRADDRVKIELSGTIFSKPVLIDVICARNGFVASIHYVKPDSDIAASSQVFEHFSEQLETVYGPPRELGSSEGRSRTYLCGDPATVMLSQYQLTATDYEVSLLIVPHRTDCQ